MEPVVTVSEGEWSTLSGIFTSEEADFMAQLLGNINGDSRIDIEIDRQENPNADFPSAHFWSVQQSSNLNIPRVYETETSPFYSSNFANPNTNYLSPSGGFDAGNGSINFPSSCYVGDKSNPILAASNDSMSMDICGGTEAGNGSSRDVGGNDFLNQEMNECNVKESSALLAKKSMQLKEKSELPGQEPAAGEKSNVSSESSKRRSRSIPNAQKMKRNIKSRKKSLSLNDLTSQNEEDGNNGNGNGQSSSTCCSEEDSQDQMGGATSTSKEPAPAPLNSNGKTRASRGSATDPQSLYARKRRERINERLRILQNLIPNGAKVDISTMLEEAVHYVKFLQLQIKLLSSDDLWMYAPIAYNGMDIGLDFNINTTR